MSLFVITMQVLSKVPDKFLRLAAVIGCFSVRLNRVVFDQTPKGSNITLEFVVSL